MNGVNEVTSFINENILHSKMFDIATETEKKKAVNQAKNMLFRYLPHVYDSTESIPLTDLSEQVIWLLKMDDSVQRAEQGATSINVDGISISYADIDRTLAPAIQRTYGIRNTRRMRVGSYNVSKHHTFRGGNNA